MSRPRELRLGDERRRDDDPRAKERKLRKLEEEWARETGGEGSFSDWLVERGIED
jgi:hypothetical protein